MRIDHLEEPELEFGSGKHIDIRFGLANYGPFDVASALAPKSIRLGIVGTPENIEGVREWLERCRGEIPPKKSNKPNLFVKFPGFRPDRAFYSTLVLTAVLERPIPARSFEQLTRHNDGNAMVTEAVQLFLDEFRYLKENQAVDVLLCAVPPEVAALIDPDTRPTGGNPLAPRLNFHDMLKARTMDGDMPPVQLILPSTYNRGVRKRQKFRSTRVRVLQDEATRAWNIHTAIYYKAKGLPWRLIRDSTRLTTCYVGVSFYASLDRSALMTSMAQIFDERGDGIVIRGGPVQLTKDDRTPHLTDADAFALLKEALARYHDAHKALPARVVVHKSSSFNDTERAGFEQAARDQRVGALDLLSTSTDASGRLFRYGAYPPLRGTLLMLDEATHMLYLRGSVDFYETYPGLYVPRPLVFRCDRIEETPKYLACEMLALSKMNWNDTQFDGGAPITITAARKVGSVLKYAGDRIAPRYSFYM